MPASKLDIILQAYDKMTAPINAAVNKAQGKLSSFAKETDRLANKAYHSGKEMMVSGFAVAAPLYKAFEAASEFETKMIDIRKQMKDDTVPSVEKMKQGVFNLAKELPLATDQIQDLIAAGLKMNIPEKNILNYTRSVTKMSIAFDMAAGEIGESMGKIANVYGIPPDDIQSINKYADVINYLDDNMMASGSDIINVLTRIGGSARNVGKDFAAVLSSSMLSVGETRERAGTALDKMLSTLSSATTKGKDFQKTLKSLHINPAQLQMDMADPARAQGAVLNVLQSLSKVDPSKQIGVATSLFGAYGTRILKMSNNMKMVTDQVEALQKGAAKNSMQKEFDKRLQSSAAQMQIFKNRIHELWVKIGTNLLPTVNKIIVKVGAWVDKIGKFIEKNPQLVNGILKAAMGFSALTIGLGYLSFVFSGFFRLLNYTGKTIKGVSGVVSYLTDKNKGLSHHIFVVRYRMLQFSDFVKGKMIPALKNFANVISTNVVKAIKSVGQTIGQVGKFLGKHPIILIIAAIALAAYLIYKYWGPIKAFFIGIWNKIKGAVMPVINFLKNLFLNFTPIGWIIKFWKPISGLVAAVFRLVMAIVGLAFRIIKWIFLNFTPIGLIIKHWGPISTFLKKLWNGIVGFFKWVWDGIKSLFQKAVKVVYEYVVVPFNKLKNAISKKFEPVVTFFRRAWEQIKAAFKKASDWIYDNTIGRLIKLKDALFKAGSNIIKAIGDGIRAGIKWLTDAVDSATQAIRDFFPFSPAKTGPLREIHRVKLLETVAGGIDTSRNNKLAKKVRESLIPVNAMIQPRSPNLALQGISPGGAKGGDFNVTINLSGGATRNDAKIIGDTVRNELKKYKDQEARRSFA